MIFDDNTAYQIYRIFVAIFGTLGMVVATSPMRKNYKRNLLFLGGYAIYAIVFTFFLMHFWGFLSFLRSVILTISLPGVIMIYMTADTTVSRHVFKCLSQLLLSLYLLISVTLLNTLFKGTLLSNAILLLSAYLAAIVLEFFVLRRAFPDITGMNTRGFGILALIPICLFPLCDDACTLSGPLHTKPGFSTSVLPLRCCHRHHLLCCFPISADTVSVSDG